MNAVIINLFYLRHSKANTNGLVPIYHRTNIDGKRIDKSTGKFIDPSKWSVESGRMKGHSEEARSINEHLDLLVAKNREIEKKLLAVDEIVSKEAFNAVSRMTGVHRTILSVFEEHNKKFALLVEQGEFAPGTLERYETSLSHTRDFIGWKYKVKDLPLSQIDFGFISDYDFYLRTQRKCANNTTVKYISNFHKIVKICLDNKWMKEDPCALYEAKVREVPRDFLMEQELTTICSKTFVSARLTQVRDIFVFCCFTGLAYIDVKQLNRNHIGIGIDGQKWIFKDRQKTDTASNIPILPFAQELLDQYADHPQCIQEGKLLPVLSNQKMNAYLKEIADVCGISKKLTFHTARHTFATTVTLTNGISLESVSKMLGHKNLKTTQHYAKILDSKVSEEMKGLKERFGSSLAIKAV